MHCYHTDNHQYLHIPKCAGTSILASLYDRRNLTVEQLHDQVRQIPHARRPYDPEKPAFAVVRHPIYRFESTWRNKVYKPHRPDTVLLKTRGVKKGMSLEDFAKEFIAHGKLWADTHVAHQTSYLPMGNLKNVTLVPFAQLQRWWAEDMESFYGPIPHKNKSDETGGKSAHLREGGSLWQQLISIYSDDMSIFEAATIKFRKDKAHAT